MHVLATLLHVAPGGAGTPTLIKFLVDPSLHHSTMETPICSRVLVSFSVPVFIVPLCSICPDPVYRPWMLGVAIRPSQPVTQFISLVFIRKFTQEAVLLLAVYGCKVGLREESQQSVLM